MTARAHSPQAYWYCHVQRYFLPYSVAINKTIEEGYSIYRVQGGAVCRAVQIDSGNYRVDYGRFVQLSVADASRYRAVRRIVLRKGISAGAYTSTRIPLTYGQILEVGGHPDGYLSDEELARGTVDGEQNAGFFPDVLTRAGVIEDSIHCAGILDGQ